MVFLKKFLLSTIQFIIKDARKSWVFFLDLIFPVECFGCGAEGDWLCDKCFKQINLQQRQYCLHCKKDNKYGRFCPSCQNYYYLDGVWIASSYEKDIIVKLIKGLKYNFVRDIANDLGKILTLFLKNLLNENLLKQLAVKDGVAWQELAKLKNCPQVILNFKESLLVPVPLSNRRKKWRGFNQAEILARFIAEKLNLSMSANGLCRVKHKKPQVKLKEVERQKNIKDCFAWRGQNLAGRNIILVDDVVTTGATLNEGAKILKDNGAGEVWALVVAKG